MKKPASMEKWGHATARERYGSLNSGGMTAKDEQAPQMPEDKQGAKYDNCTSGWVRGAGENATQKPGFDKSKGRK